MSHALSLESFEAALTEDTGPSADYDQGYQDGLAAGTAAAEGDAQALHAAFVQAVSDIDFTYAEARGQVLEALNPLLNMIAEKILPHCVESGFASQLAVMLQDAAAADSSGTIVLHVHPDQHTAVSAALDGLPYSITVATDPALDQHAAWIRQGRTETLLDMDQLLARISDILSAVHNPENRIEPHG